MFLVSSSVRKELKAFADDKISNIDETLVIVSKRGESIMGTGENIDNQKTMFLYTSHSFNPSENKPHVF